MKYNITKGGFDFDLGESGLHVNSEDGKVGFKLSEHLSVDLDGKVSFRI